MKIVLCVQIGSFSRYELIKEMIEDFISVYRSTDLFLACDQENVEFFMEKYPQAVVIGTPNLCTDLGKFLFTLKTIYFLEREYDILLKIHTKKPCKWTFDLLNILHPYTFEKIKKEFEDQHIGMVGIDYHIGMFHSRDSNLNLLREIMDLYQVDKHGNQFFSFKDHSFSQFSKEVDPKFYSSRAEFNCLNSEKIIKNHAINYALDKEICVNRKHLSLQTCYKFVVGTIFSCKFPIFKKYLPKETIDFYLTEAKNNYETGYYRDQKGEKIAHSLERLLGFFCCWDGMDVKGINLDE